MAATALCFLSISALRKRFCFLVSVFLDQSSFPQISRFPPAPTPDFSWLLCQDCKEKGHNDYLRPTRVQLPELGIGSTFSESLGAELQQNKVRGLPGRRRTRVGWVGSQQHLLPTFSLISCCPSAELMLDLVLSFTNLGFSYFQFLNLFYRILSNFLRAVFQFTIFLFSQICYST